MSRAAFQVGRTPRSTFVSNGSNTTISRDYGFLHRVFAGGLGTVNATLRIDNAADGFNWNHNDTSAGSNTILRVAIPSNSTLALDLGGLTFTSLSVAATSNAPLTVIWE